MADVFSLDDARNLLKNKLVLLIGDSNMRSIYKDLLCLLHHGGITPETVLRRGSQPAPQYGDEILDEAASKAGRGYYEVRQCKRHELWVRFIFITQVTAPSLMKELERIKDGKLPPPDIIIINSCLWDITRWGPEKEDQYKQNMARVFQRFNSLLPSTSLVMWTASLPVATERVKGGVFIKQIEFVKHSMRFMLLEANVFAHNLCRAFGFSFLDLHYYMQHQLNRRTNDGLHWEPPAVRYLTNIILTHIALSYNEALPGNVTNTFLLENHDKAKEASLDQLEGKNIYLDSKIIKYLNDELGLEVKHLTDQASPSKERGEPSRTRERRQADESSDRSSSSIGSSSRHRDRLHRDSHPHPYAGRSSLERHRGQVMRESVQERRRTPHYSADPHMDRPSCRYYTDYGHSSSSQGSTSPPLPQPLFSNYGEPLPLERQGQYAMDMMYCNRHKNYSQDSYYQMKPQCYSLVPNQFWNDYSVNNFPWNQQR